MSNEEIEEIKRHFGVVAESLRSDIRQIAEGQAVIRHELQSQHKEMKDEFKETRALMRLSFGQLDQRIHTLESDLSSVKSRMDRLESGRVEYPLKPKPAVRREMGLRLLPRSGSGWAHFDIDFEACMGEHSNERVDAEQVDLAAHEIANPRLCHAETFSSPLLSQALRSDVFFQFDHQHRTQFEILRFLRLES